MKKLGTCIPLLVTALLVGSAGGVRAEALKLGLVLGQQSWNHELEAKSLNAATEAFLLSKRFEVVERDALNTVLQEKALKGFIGDTEGAEIGQTLGLDWIGILSYAIETTPSTHGGSTKTYLLSVRMLEVASSTVLHVLDSRSEADTKESRGIRAASERLMGRKLDSQDSRDAEGVARLMDTDSMEAAGARLLENILATFPPQGYVIEVVGKREVVIDLGAAHGLREGDTLEVFMHGPPIIHPVTGREIPGREISQAELKVESVDSLISTCKVKKADGPVDVGAQVRFLPKEGLMGKALGKLPFGG
jgi:hypothetical protein